MKRLSDHREPETSKRTKVEKEVALDQPKVYYLKLIKPWNKRPTSAWGHLKQRVEVYDEFTPWVKFLDIAAAAEFLNLSYHKVHKMITRGEHFLDARGGSHRFKYRYHH